MTFWYEVMTLQSSSWKQPKIGVTQVLSHLCTQYSYHPTHVHVHVHVQYMYMTILHKTRIKMGGFLISVTFKCNFTIVFKHIHMYILRKIISNHVLLLQGTSGQTCLAFYNNDQEVFWQ